MTHVLLIRALQNKEQGGLLVISILKPYSIKQII